MVGYVNDPKAPPPPDAHGVPLSGSKAYQGLLAIASDAKAAASNAEGELSSLAGRVAALEGGTSFPALVAQAQDAAAHASGSATDAASSATSAAASLVAIQAAIADGGGTGGGGIAGLFPTFASPDASTARTVANSDALKITPMTANSSVVITIPAGLTGNGYTFMQAGTGKITFSPGAGVTLTPQYGANQPTAGGPVTSAGQNASVSFFKISGETYYIMGGLDAI